MSEQVNGQAPVSEEPKLDEWGALMERLEAVYTMALLLDADRLMAGLRGIVLAQISHDCAAIAGHARKLAEDDGPQVGGWGVVS